MKFVVISDTHGQHKQLKLPEGDVILHAGDVSGKGRYEQVLDFLEWFSGLDYKYRIFIAGNHDFYFEKTEPERIKNLIPANVIYLNDSGVTIEGIKIWGSPITPWFFNWAFNRQRGPEIRAYWDCIPDDTEILMTHGPAYGILDKVKDGEKVGCSDLLKRIKELEPRYHICGHIHEAYGQRVEGKTNTLGGLDHRHLCFCALFYDLIRG